MKILSVIGTLPGPSHVRVHRLQGQGVILFRAAQPEAPKARNLVYASGHPRPSVSVLTALRAEGVTVPKKMCMDVPVRLVEDDEGLALAAYFKRGKLRNATETESES